MWIQVRSMDGQKNTRVDGLSKLTKVEDLREKLVDDFDASVERQKLFYRGKLMVDGHTLFDYDVGLNALIQIMVRPPIDSKADDANEKKNEDKKEELTEESSEVSEQENYENSIFKMGDIVDCRDETMGSWFEAKIVKINESKEESKSSVTPKDDEMDVDQNENSLKDSDKENIANNLNTEEKSESTEENATDVKTKATVNGSIDELQTDGFVYHVQFEGYEEDDIVKITSQHIRPRSRHKIPFDKLEIGSKVMLNYNYDEPDGRGYWYDGVITGKRNTRTIKEVHATVYIGKDLVPFENCQVLFRDEVFRIEEPGTQLNVNDPQSAAQTPVKRTNKPECDHCQDNPRRKCKFCSCSVCGDKKEPEKQVLCDECDQAYHIYCLKKPLADIPDVDEWFCPECKNDVSEVVQSGEKLKESKKKSKMASATGSSSRDWGRGMACVGRSKQCNLVQPNHFGPIPGIEVGQMWKFRVQVSEVGVHRPHVAGIHGREDDGAYSLVLSGGYEDDVDDGGEFTYTGSGGRDLSGNKRTAEQSCDQTLTRMNRALAKNCDASIDGKKGAEAKDWRKGKPVRVVRNCKGRKHSKYAPEFGNRYDGIYKIVKYWPDKGKSGFIVWRYMLRRDDPIPAPWTKAGKKRSLELGLEMEIPEGYVEKELQKQKDKENGPSETPGKGKKRGRKRQRIESDEEEDEETDSPAKKKQASYKVPSDILKNIKADKRNQKLWHEAQGAVPDGVQKFLSKVEELFLCICCQEIVCKPITTECSHNLCKPCLKRSFQADVHSCPACRTELGKDYNLQLNDSLAAALNGLYPGYESSR